MFQHGTDQWEDGMFSPVHPIKWHNTFRERRTSPSLSSYNRILNQPTKNSPRANGWTRAWVFTVHVKIQYVLSWYDAECRGQDFFFWKKLVKLVREGREGGEILLGHVHNPFVPNVKMSLIVWKSWIGGRRWRLDPWCPTAGWWWGKAVIVNPNSWQLC